MNNTDCILLGVREVLSPRQFEVFALLGRAVPNQDIAKRLRLSVKTVETHMAAVCRKLGLGNTRELLRAASIWDYHNNPRT